MDVIYAPASGGGKAAVSVIRLSGAGADVVLRRLAGPLPRPRSATLRRLKGRAGVLDEALVLWFPGPASFTGEDVAELHIHGSRAVAQAVLAELATFDGCRLAEPGEFAKRAFRNGKRDLASLEGLADLIDAETEAQRRQAVEQLSGELGRRVSAWSARALDMQAQIEAELDFSDEGDVETDLSSLRGQAEALAAELDRATSGFAAAERVRDGFRIVIAGPPNAGKSSLLNAIARRDVAIVTETPGTTRDVIDVALDLTGLPVILSDTAGVRAATDAIEQEGIARAQQRMADADLVWWLARTREEAAPAPAGARVVASQRDRFGGEPSPDWADAAISARTGAGLPQLLEDARRVIAERASPADAAVVVRARHVDALQQAGAALRRAGAALPTPELAAEDLRLARRALGRIMGATDVEDVLDVIFGRFCIGK